MYLYDCKELLCFYKFQDWKLQMWFLVFGKKSFYSILGLETGQIHKVTFVKKAFEFFTICHDLHRQMDKVII